MKYLILDFNGTIVDDLNLSLESINYCLKKYINKEPLTVEKYKDIFCFPVIEYYKKAGFDFDKVSWDEVANCWMKHYQKHHHECKIHDGIIDLINEGHNKGYRCVVMSASEINILTMQLKEFGIYELFDDIVGMSDIYAESKIDAAVRYFKGKDLKDSILIGDTNHDKEVADAIGSRCILVGSGHQSMNILRKCNDIVYNSIKEINL